MGMPKRKRKAKIKIRQTATLEQKKDKTRVARQDTTVKRRVPVQTFIPDNGVTFKIKVRKK